MASSAAARTSSSTSRSCAATACPRSWRSTRSQPTSRPRSPSSSASRSPPAQRRPWSAATSPAAVPGQRSSPGLSGRRRRKGAPDFRFLSREDASLEERITRIATRVYGADGVDFSGEARKQLHEFERLGHGHMPVCMAKTALSLSHDPALKGRPTGFRVPIRDARLFAGAGFVTAYCGDMLMMPGLPSRPIGRGGRHQRRRRHGRPFLAAADRLASASANKRPRTITPAATADDRVRPGAPVDGSKPRFGVPVVVVGVACASMCPRGRVVVVGAVISSVTAAGPLSRAGRPSAWTGYSNLAACA